MRIVILLCCVWLVRAGIFPEKYGIVTFNGKLYYKEVLLTNITKANDFSYDERTNTLYFSYYPLEYYKIRTDIAYYNIDTKEFKTVYDGKATCINSETRDIYLGQKYGIYKFISLNKTVEYYAAQGVDINFMYCYNSLLYYTDSNNRIYRCDGREDKKVSNIEVEKLIGDDEKYYFFNSSGLFRVLDNEEENAEKLSDSSFYRNKYKMFAKDRNNKIFVIGEDGVHILNDQEKKLVNVADIKDIIGLAFDKNNNIIYSDSIYIYRLNRIH